ncbi:MAG: SDR family NAD(P)-dependent oxidoreductase [Vicingaceae bacterium]
MNYYFITGTSKGLGKSLVEILLKDESNFIYGLSRACSLKHERHHHTKIDLSNLDEVLQFNFPELNASDNISLINNAGMVGDIKHVGTIDNKKIIDCYNLNLITPSILTNNFIAKYAHLKGEKTVLNISSGAGRSPIDGWNVYCATKAGLDMFSRVLSEETTIDNTNIKVLSLAPGIIDTEMQSEIRKAEKTGFSNKEKFINYKKQGELVAADETAKKVIRFINEKALSKNTICSVREL